MKKTRVFGLMMACMLVVTALFAPAAMAADGDDDRIPANDIVIVVDQSRSMNTTKQKPSDPDGYRIDAAQMIVGMCDMEKSRVAIVPFAGKLLDPDTEFVPINEQLSREQKMNQVGKLHSATTQSDTDMGDALSYAVKLLIEREDQSNNPMIIVLTDGKLELTQRGGQKYHDDKRVYLYDGGSYSEVNVNDYGADNDNSRSNNGRIINAETQMNDAVQVAKAHGIPVYCVALNAADPDMVTHAAELSRIADETGGEYFGKDITDPATLPQVFAKVFADQIGSSLREELHPVMDGKHCSITFPILNTAVLEANIYVPLDNVDPNSFELYQGDSTQNLSAGGGQVVKLEGKRFVLYKIRPNAVGDWTLKFDLKDEKKSAANISLNLLYNYDVTFKTEAGVNPAALVPQGQAMVFGKDDNLYITSGFYVKDPATQALVPSGDVNLYKQQDGDDWKTIHVTCELIDDAGIVCYRQELNRKSKSFDLDIDLAAAALDEQGHTRLHEGKYTLRVVADGAGLRRENELQIELTNTAPSVPGNISIGVEVNNPAKPETKTAQTGLREPLASYVSDPDNDEMSFYLTPKAGAESILKAKLEKNADGTMDVVYNTLMGADGKVVSGVAEYDLTVTDADGDSSTAVLTFNVSSGVDDVLNNTDWLTSAPAIVNGKAAKNTDVAFELEVLPSSGSTVKFDLSQIDAYVYITDLKTNNVIETVQMTLDGDKLVGVYHTGNKQANLQAECTYLYGGFKAEGKGVVFPFEVPNAAPVYVGQTIETFGGELPDNPDPSRVDVNASLPCNPLPSFLSFLEPSYQPSYALDLNEWFADADNESGLLFDEPVLVDRDGNTAANMTYVRTGDVVELFPAATGNVQVTLRAVDGDGEEAVVTLHIGVNSLVRKWLLIVAAAIALIVIANLIRLAARPRFFKGMRLTVRSNTAIDPDQIIDGIVGQKPVKLSTFVVEPVSLQNSGVTSDDLDQIAIRPMRGRGSKVLLTYTARRKNFSNPRVELGGVEVMSGKSMEWTLDTELEVHHSAENGNCLRITLESQNGSFSPSMMDPSAGYMSGADVVDSSANDTPDW